ncbi:GmrSD restriction endonuclease domain-containing protein [Idiomarina abyssalis]|uniref:GmrSD restriction endonuclease domain-containing protein n=1 Tax=Idiomarina abyssalis TaxID=86102 RepID=UPI001C95D450|nr:DUF262 domain-containing protein [Idiomarina abyssalis]QZN90447.1 DUF262 domain-containing protein [Idiomarina abyssalis]
MSITPRGMSVQEAYRLFRDDKLIVNRKYQRKLVWTTEEKQNLIDSLIKDYPIPLILLADASEGANQIFEIMDGMQRLNAIFSFIENSFPVNGKYFDTNEFTRARQAAESGAFTPSSKDRCEFFAPNVCADILDYQLAVTTFPIESDKQVTDVFGRINSGGKQLSAQEKRQAGMTDSFSMVVRELSSEIRGDSSKNKLALSEMPEISIDSVRTDLGYALKAEEIFWCKQGILWNRHLRDSEDEEMLADICSSIVLGEPIARSKVLFDKIYDESASEYEKVRREFTSYGKDRLIEEVKVTLSVLREVIDGYSTEPNALRTIVNPKSANPIKGSFFAIFMAFHKLVISEEKTPSDYSGIMEALSGLHKKMISSAKFSTTPDRIKNIDTTTGLIQRYFVKTEPPMLRHGAGLALDLENSLRRSRIETSRYECKQGFVDLSASRKFDSNLPKKIIETICAIANVGPDADGYIFIGVADSATDANRIEKLDNVTPVKVGARYVVGLERERAILGYDEEQYLEKIMAYIRNADLSEPLKSQVLSQSDYVEYKSKSVLRLRIPAQSELSFLGDDVYIRENSSTVLATGKKMLAANKIFL